MKMASRERSIDLKKREIINVDGIFDKHVFI